MSNPTGNESADASGAEHPARSYLEIRLAACFERRAEHLKAHKARIEALTRESNRYIDEIDEEIEALRESIGERQRGSQT